MISNANYSKSRVISSGPFSHDAAHISNRSLFAPLLDIVFSTAHKAKGLEFDTVRITDDFLPGSDTEMMSLRKSHSRRHQLSIIFFLCYLTTTFLFSSFFVYDKLKAPIPPFFSFLSFFVFAHA